MKYLQIFLSFVVFLSLNSCAVYNAQRQSTLSRAEQSRGAEIGNGSYYSRTVDGIVYQINTTNALTVDGRYAVKLINCRTLNYLPTVEFVPIVSFGADAILSYTFMEGKTKTPTVWLAPGEYRVNIFVYDGPHYRDTHEPDCFFTMYVGNAEHRIAECDTIFGGKVKIY